MKNILTYIAVISSIALTAYSLTGCLDLDPSDKYSEATVWNSKESVDQYIYGLYAVIKENSEIFNPAKFTDAYSDLIKSSSWNQYKHYYNMALLQETTFNSSDAGPFECWADLYNRIRRENEFLRDAAANYNKIGEETMRPRVAEVRFIRAFVYMQLIRIYGGVVIRKEVDGPKQNDKARSSEQDSWRFVMQELEEAARNLPLSWPAVHEGRVTKAAAWGLLSRSALYAKDWAKAIEAADSCKKAGGQLAENYSEIFSDRSSKENLMTVQFLPGYFGFVSHRHDTFFRPYGDSKNHKNAVVYAAFGPTAELADSYEMQDGTPFSWATHGAEPYKNREPRFYATILYNGAEWENRQIETFVGGSDGIQPFTLSGTASASVTGYYFKKFIKENDKSWETEGSSHFGIIIRYGEVLLNKAEAQAEAGNIDEALISLNEIRERADLPKAAAANKDDFMKQLRHERIVELAGEGFRYWDLRRWRLAETYLNGTCAHGVKITKNTGTGDLSYTEVEIDAGQKRIFYDRYYAFSIPITERTSNKLLGPNNPGW